MNMTALDVFNCPLSGKSLIEASAGTGKTWNICGLYLRLLLEQKLDVRQILVVTFTKAATAELRDRIRQRMVETLRQLRDDVVASDDPFVGQLLDSLRAQGLEDINMTALLELALACFDEASIFTIHSFCQRALADTPFTAQMPLAMELLQDDAELRLRVVNDFWRRHIAADAAQPLLVQYLLSRNDSPEKFGQLLKRHLAKPLARIEWPAAINQTLSLDTQAFEQSHLAARELWQLQRAAIIQTLLDGLGSLNAQTYKPESVQSAADEWDVLLAQPDVLSVLHVATDKAKLFGQDFLTSKTKKNQITPVQVFFTLAEHWLQQRDLLLADLRLLRLQLLKTLFDEASAALSKHKRARRVVAFDDMLSNLHQRLHDGTGWLAQALRQRFPAALIDEFQDTDPQQFGIFSSMYAEDTHSLFLVGDPKQAIYGFRNADLQTYLKARQLTGAQYTLVENQRSEAGLIMALNALFSANSRLFMLPGLEYQSVRLGQKPRKTFTDHSQQPLAPLTIWMLPGLDGQSELLMKADAKSQVVHATASEIVRLLDAGQHQQIAIAGKPLQAGDIAVLVRTHAEGSLMRQALSQRGVGSVELSQQNVFASLDAEELDVVLSAILEPGRGPIVKSALATELMGWDAASLLQLGDDEPQFAAVTLRLAGYRQLWLERGIGVMLRQWLSQDHISSRMLRRSDGERRLTNLLHLSECLQQAEQDHPAADALLLWLQSQRKDGDGDESRQLRLESDQNLVQIVTIHRSKGLEYPLVFCPFLWDGRLNDSANKLDGLEYHADDGEATIDFRSNGDAGYQDDVIKTQRKLENSAEFLRLLYVALTRAVHRCVLVAGCYQVASGRGISAKESQRSLLNWSISGEGRTAEQWLSAEQTLPAIAQAWQAWARQVGAAVSLLPLPPASNQRLDVDAGYSTDLQSLTPPSAITGSWWLGSFSSLAHGTRSEQAAADHDARSDTTQRPPPPELAVDDILHFPRGAQAGTCIHSVFEQIDFTNPAGWPGVIERAVRQLPATACEDAALRGGMLHNMLNAVLQTPLALADGQVMQLATLPLNRRLTEWEFHLPARHFSAARCNEILRRHQFPLPPLGFSSLQGFLKGFVDLIFEHKGRYYVLDWKSNHLGHAPQDYAAAGMAEAMTEHLYSLQYLLYCVALDCYLRRRLPGYDPALHLGGAVYVFVRGVRPHWRDAAGQACGVFYDRPSPELIAELGQLFSDPETHHV